MPSGIRQLNGVDQRTLVVGLHEPGLMTPLFGVVRDHAAQVGVGAVAVNVRLTLPQQVQVGAVEDQKLHAFLQISAACAASCSAVPLPMAASAQSRYQSRRRPGQLLQCVLLQ